MANFRIGNSKFLPEGAELFINGTSGAELVAGSGPRWLYR